jgi:hypothetical protein
MGKKENQFWKLRSKHGRDKIFSNPEILWQEACTFFEWCDSNPLSEQKAFGTGKKLSVERMRAYTMKGLCYFLKIGESTYNDYKHRDEFKEVIEQIEQVLFNQKFTGAAAGLLNANIISRDLGLKDVADLTTDGESLNNAFASTIGKIRKKLKENDEQN